MVYAPVRPDRSLPPVTVNLFSDTQTRPSAAMKDAMMQAEVGDEQNGDDPTVWALCERMAALTGKEAAVFLPTGTMCNQISLLVHCRPGDEILAHESSHIVANEGGGPGALAGAVILGLRGPRGMFDVPTMKAAIRERRRNAPPQTLVAVEQTANAGGGSVWPIAQLNAVLMAAHDEGMATHMDGARLMNAAVAAGVAARDMAEHCDSVWLDFTKGLGAPLGAVLCGSAAFIDQAWRWKQRLGGSMRQAGLCAAAFTRLITMLLGLPTTMPMPGCWRAACRNCRGCLWKIQRPTWCSLIRAAPGRRRMRSPCACGRSGCRFRRLYPIGFWPARIWTWIPPGLRRRSR